MNNKIITLPGMIKITKDNYVDFAKARYLKAG
jgi:hypothetical protein